MIHVPEPPSDPPSIRALAVPADPTKPVRVVFLNDETSNSTATLQRLVGGHIELQAHNEGDVWLNDEGRLINLPFNVRANHWLVNTSDVGRRGLVSESAMLYGDIVITGPPNRNGDMTSVDPHLIDHFQSLQFEPEAVHVHIIEIVVLPSDGDLWPNAGL